MLLKKLYLATMIFLLISISGIFAQEKNPNTEKKQLTPSMWYITVAPVGIINLKENSAPTPFLYSLGGGLHLPLIEWLSFAPQARLFWGTYLWDNTITQALPAEIEQRTAYVPSIILDIPLSFDFKFAFSTFRVSPGISILARYGFLASGVPSNETVDVQKINAWFWQGLHYFYPSFHLTWDFAFPSGMQAGFSAGCYIPVGELVETKTWNTGMVTLGLRFFIPKIE